MRALLVAALMLAFSSGQVPPVQRPGEVAPPARPPGAADPSAAGTGIVRGRILGPTGRPLRGARVQLLPTEPPRQPRVAVTDADGRYEIKELRAAAYTLIASRPGYISLELGQRRAFERGQPFTLGDGEIRERVDVTLPRNGAITGRVVDEFGDPVEGISIQLLQHQFGAGRRLLMPVSGVRPRQTNDLGRYRLYGVPPGRYVVSVSAGDLAPGNPQAGGASSSISGYQRTFFPGTPIPAEAQIVTVDLSQEVPAIDIRLVPGRGARISGTVRDSSGKPAQVMLLLSGSMRSGGLMLEPMRPTRRPDGSFEANGLAPGEYVLQVIGPPAHADQTKEGEFASRYITVAGQDITDLQIQTTVGSTVSGRVIAEGTAKPGDFLLRPAPTDFDRAPMVGEAGARVRIGDDWTFEIGGLSGPRRFVLSSAPPGWVLKSVRVRGLDATDVPLQFGSKDESLTDVEIVVTARGAEVRGQAVDGRGQPVGDYTAIVFATDRDRWYQFSRFMKFARPNQDGSFVIRGLPAGDYYLAAVNWMQGTEGAGEWQDPAFLESIAPLASKVGLTEGQQLSTMPRLIVR